MYDERLDIGYVCEIGEDLQMVNEVPGCLLTAVDLEREDGAGSVREVAFVEIVVRMVGQRRVVNLLH